MSGHLDNTILHHHPIQITSQRAMSSILQGQASMKLYSSEHVQGALQQGSTASQGRYMQEPTSLTSSCSRLASCCTAACTMQWSHDTVTVSHMTQ